MVFSMDYPDNVDINCNKMQRIKDILKTRNETAITSKTSPYDEEPVRTKLKLLLLIFGVLIPLCVCIYDLMTIGHVPLVSDSSHGISFRNLFLFAVEYLKEIAIVLVAYVAIYVWARGRIFASKFGIFRKVWNNVWIMFYIYYFLWSTHRVFTLLQSSGIPLHFLFYLYKEKFRFFMKIHSYTKTVVLRYRKGDYNYPHVSKYLYFIMAPTLEYCDSYARASGNRRWGYIMSTMLKYIICCSALAFYFTRFLFVFSTYFWTAYSKWTAMFFTYWLCVLFAFPTFVAGAFNVLHCECNIFAELLRFANRNFYKRWWQATNFQQFNTDWNQVVNGWLEVNVYDDIKRALPKTWNDEGLLAVFITFFFSSVYHDYLFAPLCGDFIANFTFMFGIASVGAYAFIGRKTRPSRSSVWKTWMFNFLTMGLILFIYVEEATVLQLGCKEHLNQSRVLQLRLPSFVHC